MAIYKNKGLWRYLGIIFLVGPVFLAGCHDEDNGSSPVILLDTTQQLAPGGCASPLFNGEAGVPVKVEATGPSNENPDLTIFDPNNNQVATATNSTLGSETLGFTPSITGGYTVRVCDVNNVGGAVRVVVTQR